MILAEEWEMFFGQFSEEIVDLHCINDGFFTRFSSGRTCDSAIDLTFSNSLALLLTARWEVIRESWGSDHFPIKTEIIGSIKNQLRFNVSSRIYSTKTDWKAVESDWCSRISECIQLRTNNNIDCQARYTSFMAMVEDCVRIRTPKRNINTFNNNSSRSNHTRASTW